MNKEDMTLQQQWGKLNLKLCTDKIKAYETEITNIEYKLDHLKQDKKYYEDIINEIDKIEELFK